MQTSHISRSAITQFSAFSAAFGNQDSFAQFIQTPFHSLDDVTNQIQLKKGTYTSEKRTALVSVLAGQLEGKASSVQLSVLELLKLDTTFTITTGHQLTLFGGPLYLIYKVLHIVKLSESYNQLNTGFQTVPVFWMASEDHDLDEVRSTHLFNQKLTWETTQTGPVGRMSTTDFSSVLEQFSALFEGKETLVQELLSLHLDENYTNYLLTFLSKLFAAFGVLVLNPDSRELKHFFVPVMERELLKQVSLPQVEKTNKLLEAAGYKPQAQAREINLFYLSDGARTRIEQTATGFSAGSHHFTESEILDKLNKEPEQFSPNVILRPVYQETILPNLAYIGGGGEMAYWIQLKGVFSAHETLYPLIQQRNSLHLIDGGMSKRMEKVGMDTARFFEPKENLRKAFLAENDGDSLDTSGIQNALAQLKEAMISKASELDASLNSFAEAETVRVSKQLEQFEQRLIKHVKQQHEGALKAIDFVCERFVPENELQERYFHILNFAPTGDFQPLMDQMYAAMDPFCADLIVLNV